MAAHHLAGLSHGDVALFVNGWLESAGLEYQGGKGSENDDVWIQFLRLDAYRLGLIGFWARVKEL